MTTRPVLAQRAIDQLLADLELLAARAERVRPGYALILNAAEQQALARALGSLAYLVEFQLTAEDGAGAKPWTAMVDRLLALERRAG